MSTEKYQDVKVTKAKGKKVDDVSASAFQMMKGAYSLGGLFPQVVEKKEDEPDVMETCNLLVNLWTNKKVSLVTIMASYISAWHSKLGEVETASLQRVRG